MLAGRIKVSTREFTLKEIPTPQPALGQVRIQVKAAGVCLSDVHFIDGTISPGYLVGDEVTLGHEVAGIIDAVGTSVNQFFLGDRVLICAGVRDELNRVTTLGFDYDGGFAEYVIADANTVLAIPENLPFEQACIIPDAVSTPWAAITQTAQMKKGESAAVFGIGGLGIHAVQLLKIIGVSPVIAVDPLLQARKRALQVGADAAFDPLDADFIAKVKALQVNKGFNAAFDFAGVASARTQALRLLDEGGRLVIIGLANESITIPNDIAFAYKRNQVLGHYGSEPSHTKELIELIKEGRLDLSESVSETMPLKKIEEALEKLKNKSTNPIRIVVIP